MMAMIASGHSAWSQMITAHRGASHDAPENTLAAFKLAWEQGADAVEGDFYLTADRQIVCIHDADTKRTTGTKRMVETSTLHELRQLDAGSWKSTRFAGEKLPTFAEVLATVPAGKRVVIELKSDERIVPKLVEEIETLAPDPKSLMIISFHAESIRQCKLAMPEVQAHWLTSFKQDKSVDGVWKPTVDVICQTVAQCAADGVGVKGQREVVDSSFVAALAAGQCREFHVWTIDDPDEARFFASLGSIGITTNRPAFIRKALATSGP